ncbi:hypothetical protein [Streptomyces sp. NBC_01190]|uniref:hypothetical protein n=1 Tax=Streptomyces sp. NBC_01190 TaxID=2903767 RepID=UPI00386366FB|nr:hypothetical protein OG519_00465 [Streptomyces sp. NBC_01190]
MPDARDAIRTAYDSGVGFARAGAVLRLNLERWAHLYAKGDERLGAFLTALTLSGWCPLFTVFSGGRQRG